ncbi:hypothetical protein [Methylobacter sp.]|uniref:hypothetical protein n=1 Tax=Methylobacter sp. TaxID=2051955 RepID=UPI003DA37B7E
MRKQGGRPRLPEIEPGTRFGKWEVIKLVRYDKFGGWYECVCDCGTIRELLSYRLRNARTRSCKKCALSFSRKGNFNNAFKEPSNSLTPKQITKEMLEKIKDLPINKALTEAYRNRKKE